MIPTARMRTATCAIALVIMLAGSAEAGTEINRILATVDGEPLTQFEFDAYAAGFASTNAPPAELLRAFLTEKMLEKEAAAKGITVDPADVDAYIAEIQSNPRFNEEAFAAALAAQGLTMETYRKRISDELLKTQLVTREIRARVTVPPEQVEAYYEDNKDLYLSDGGRIVRDIFLPLPPEPARADVERVRAAAEQLAAEATTKRRFSELARQYSQGAGAEQGGLLGTFRQGSMTDELDAAVFALDVGEVSAPVLAGGGFHVLRVDDEIDAGHRPLEDVQEEIHDALYQEALDRRYQEWLSVDLPKAHHVEVLN